MRCPDCSADLQLAFALELRDDDRPVTIDHQWWRCPGCGARFFSRLVEDKTNIFDDDLISTGVRPEPDDWERTRAQAAACPRPQDKACDCAVHQAPPRCHGPQVWYLT